MPLLRKYISYAKQIRPVITEESLKKASRLLPPDANKGN